MSAGGSQILVVDDEEANLTVLQRVLEKEGYEVSTAGNGPDGLDALRSVQPALLLTDLKMPGMDGLELLRASRAIAPTTEVILMTAFGTVEVAVEAMKEGAYDFITKPLKRHDIVRAVGKGIEKAMLVSENRRLREQIAAGASVGPLGEVIGRSRPFRAVMDVVDQVAPSEATVLISGESGTGKELLARAIHELSARRGEPLITVNCAAIPENLIESELFGYEKGAFTGAADRKPGRFELAQGGTLFLDEVGEMSQSVQVKLLRILQEGEFERVGGTRTLQLDVRILAATNRDLERAVAQRTFREDLFYRLNVIPLKLPPLRERRDDIPLLAAHFVSHYSQRNGKPIKGITDDALQALAAYR